MVYALGEQVNLISYAKYFIFFHLNAGEYELTGPQRDFIFHAKPQSRYMTENKAAALICWWQQSEINAEYKEVLNQTVSGHQPKPQPGFESSSPVGFQTRHNNT